MSVLSDHTREGVRMSAKERAARGDQIQQMYESGKSLAEIAPRVNRTRERVRQILVKRGVQLRRTERLDERS